jgi:hypothetical protein
MSTGIPGGQGAGAVQITGLRLNSGAKNPTCLPLGQ